MIVFIIVILLIIIAIILNNPKIYNKEEKNKKINFSNYVTKNYVMTPTELKFYRELKKITDELDLEIFPQVNLEKIIQIKDKNQKERNKIKSRSIDYTIVNNRNCKIVACLELDDYSHNRENVKRNDEFKNEIFKQVNIPLIRIKVQSNYNMKEIKEKLIEINKN